MFEQHISYLQPHRFVPRDYLLRLLDNHQDKLYSLNYFFLLQVGSFSLVFQDHHMNISIVFL